MRLLGMIIRFIVSALVLLLVSAIVPGFSISGFGTALFAAIVIAVIGWLLELLLGRNHGRGGRGLVGFVLSIVVIYVAQIFVSGMHVTVLGAILAAFIIGIIDLFVPTELRK
ncbi:phage holin family protein [Alicyclobacillus fodiniaquatilis]|uniref:Phage holin family protein n=1 Tax=Alicyclobacillus fodiniaquatilis TaxID=1661150 RepID=A0ABW4JML6_9BACL